MRTMQKKKIKKILKIARNIFLIMSFFVVFTYLPSFIGEHSEHMEVLSIESVSAGTLFSPSVCLYETTKGQVLDRCIYEPGDTIIKTKW